MRRSLYHGSSTAGRRHPRTHALLWHYGLLFALLGAALTFLSIVISRAGPASLGDLVSDGIQALGVVGIAIFSIGVVGVLLDFPEWRKYFQDRLADIVRDKAYLSTLSREELVVLQTATLEAFFGADNIDAEGSFLKYFQRRIHNLIGSPYREDSHDSVAVELDAENNCLVVTDTMTYICRAVGDQLQEYIDWSPEHDEFEEIEDLQVRLRGEFVQEAIDIGAHTIISGGLRETRYSYDDIRDRFGTDLGEMHFPLYKLSPSDGLRVEIQAKYRLRMNRFLTWQMAQSTKRFALSVSYPKTLEPVYQTVGIPKEDYTVQTQSGLLSIYCDTWALPDSGVVVQFVRGGSMDGTEREQETGSTPP